MYFGRCWSPSPSRQPLFETCPGYPGSIPGTSLRKSFSSITREGTSCLTPHPFAWKNPTQPDGLRTQTFNLCALGGSERNYRTPKHINNFFHGIVPGFSGDSVYVFPFPHMEMGQPKRDKQLFDPQPSPLTIPPNCLCLADSSLPHFCLALSGTRKVPQRTCVTEICQTFRSTFWCDCLEALVSLGIVLNVRTVLWRCDSFLAHRFRCLSEPDSLVPLHLECRTLETILACCWEGVRLPQSSWQLPGLPIFSTNFPRSSAAASLELLSLWVLRATQSERFAGSFPDLSGRSHPGSSQTSLQVSAFLWEAWHPLMTHNKPHIRNGDGTDGTIRKGASIPKGIKTMGRNR